MTGGKSEDENTRTWADHGDVGAGKAPSTLHTSEFVKTNWLASKFSLQSRKSIGFVSGTLWASWLGVSRTFLLSRANSAFGNRRVCCTSHQTPPPTKNFWLLFILWLAQKITFLSAFELVEKFEFSRTRCRILCKGRMKYNLKSTRNNHFLPCLISFTSRFRGVRIWLRSAKAGSAWQPFSHIKILSKSWTQLYLVGHRNSSER